MYTFEKKENQGILNVKVSKEDWEAAVERSYEKNKGKFNIQGFRKGKAPRRVIEQNYGDTVFFDDAFDEVISNEYSKFLFKVLFSAKRSNLFFPILNYFWNNNHAELSYLLFISLRRTKASAFSAKDS